VVEIPRSHGRIPWSLPSASESGGGNDEGSAGIEFMVRSSYVAKEFGPIGWHEKQSYVKQDRPPGIDRPWESFLQAVRIRRTSLIVNRLTEKSPIQHQAETLAARESVQPAAAPSDLGGAADVECTWGHNQG
jgi:hypothetical protein